MGLLGRFGERNVINAKHARPQEEPTSQSEQKRYEFLTFDEIRTLEPVAPCGFDFCNVSYHVRRRIDKATGEVEESEWCDLEEPNYTRNMQAILHSWYVFSQADRATDGWPSNEYGRIMKEACVLGPSYKDKSRFHYTFGVIKAIPPEPYGDPPKVPCRMLCGMQRAYRRGRAVHLRQQGHDAVNNEVHAGRKPRKRAVRALAQA